MPRRLTQAEFDRKRFEKHGYKYERIESILEFVLEDLKVAA